ncbi:MAG: hypothetical protein HC782_01575 [Gammaproteobacteria bacterium]|nr:hypothetical protein [Gammaproteobacteria bacterium]
MSILTGVLILAWLRTESARVEKRLIEQARGGGESEHNCEYDDAFLWLLHLISKYDEMLSR